MPTLKQVEQYHRLKERIRDLILKNVGNNEIIYGSQAINKQVPKHLQSFTRDFDIYADDPLQEAEQLDYALDKMMGFNSFEVRRARYPHTQKVKSRVTGRTHADYTKPQNKVPYVVIEGKKYAKLDYIKKQKIKTLKKGIATHRKLKDQDQLNRIRIAQQRRGFKPLKWEGEEMRW